MHTGRATKRDKRGKRDKRQKRGSRIWKNGFRIELNFVEDNAYLNNVLNFFGCLHH